MKNFKLLWNYIHPGDGYDAFEVKCDNKRCVSYITCDPRCLKKWIDDLLLATRPDHNRRLRVSMDMIWDKYRVEGNLKPPVTLQFCHESSCIIYHVSPSNNFPWSSLEQFLNHRYVDFVGFRMFRKVDYLYKAHYLTVNSWNDILYEATVLDSTKFSTQDSDSPVQYMVSRVYLKWYPKPTNLLCSNWRLMRLSPDKVMYATLDCYLAYQLAARLSIPRKASI